MNRLIILFGVLIIAGCAYQDLKAPHHLGPLKPVIQQWHENDVEQLETRNVKHGLTNG